MSASRDTEPRPSVSGSRRDNNEPMIGHDSPEERYARESEDGYAEHMANARMRDLGDDPDYV